MVLNVFDESWVIKLGRVIAAGRQIAVRQGKTIYDMSYFSYCVVKKNVCAFK